MANACIYKGVLELSLALLFSALHAYPHTTTTLLTLKMRPKNLFNLRGSSSASLQVHLLYSITINGCLVQHLDLDIS